MACLQQLNSEETMAALLEQERRVASELRQVRRKIRSASRRDLGHKRRAIARAMVDVSLVSAAKTDHVRAAKTHARWAWWWICVRVLGASIGQVARETGHHESTISTGVKRAESTPESKAIIEAVLRGDATVAALDIGIPGPAVARCKIQEMAL